MFKQGTRITTKHNDLDVKPSMTVIIYCKPRWQVFFLFLTITEYIFTLLLKYNFYFTLRTLYWSFLDIHGRGKCSIYNLLGRQFFPKTLSRLVKFVFKHFVLAALSHCSLTWTSNPLLYICTQAWHYMNMVLHLPGLINWLRNTSAQLNLKAQTVGSPYTMSLEGQVDHPVTYLSPIARNKESSLQATQSTSHSVSKRKWVNKIQSKLTWSEWTQTQSVVWMLWSVVVPHALRIYRTFISTSTTFSHSDWRAW